MSETVEPLLVRKPWGGSFLGKVFGSSDTDIGEAWLLSTLKEGQSQIGEKKLSEVLGAPLKFVVKVIDAKENLSVQVHPNDEWAKRLENSKGKTECWLIVASEKGAGVYLGLKAGVTKEVFEEALKNSRPVDHMMKFYETKRGDFIVVPAGTIHAIGGGVTLLEVQQASGITYRLWDWGRAGRELHHEKGLQVSNFSDEYEIRENVLSGKAQELLEHSDFKCFYNKSVGEGWFIDLKTFAVFHGSKSPFQDYVFVSS